MPTKGRCRGGEVAKNVVAAAPNAEVAKNVVAAALNPKSVFAHGDLVIGVVTNE